MIDHGTLLSIPFLKKSRFTGSDRGMRYSIYKIEEENETFLEAAACPGPFSVDFTKPELFTKKRFSFDDEGRAAAVGKVLVCKLHIFLQTAILEWKVFCDFFTGK